VDLRKIKKLIELLEESALVEMEITEGDNSIRLSRGGQSGVQYVPQQQQPMVSPAVAMESPRVEPQPAAAEPASGTLVESPMVGTYYDAPSPDAGPFVKVGSEVRRGDTLCIVEAMKTFNQIEAEADGVIRVIHKSNGDPVEYGEPLFLIG
jgi:acetyl-CoA carboxylase biotin carboxyl carrier protein